MPDALPPEHAQPDDEAAEPDGPPAPRDISGLIGPTLVGMVVGVGVVLLILWLS